MDTETKEITKYEDVIDVRDIIARVEHLEALRQPGPVDLGADNDADQDVLFAELAVLESLLEDLCGNGGDEDWRGNWYPLLLVRDSYFEDFAVKKQKTSTLSNRTLAGLIRASTGNRQPANCKWTLQPLSLTA